MKSLSILCLTTALTAGLSVVSAGVRADDRAPAALTGQVSSDAEGAMEGVVVTARKDGSIVSTSVATDAKGRYAFPESRMDPGHYNIAIRAVGYDLAAPASTNVAAERTTNLDLKLDKTHDLASQLSNAEWMMSIPGTEEQKAMLLDCQGCHTLERIVRSTHDVNEWMATITRMKGYGAVSQPAKPQPMLDPDRAGKPEEYRQMAEYLATINLSATDHWHYSLKMLPRPTGRSTHVIVTEYDVIRPTTEPHDVVLDKDGNVWYSDFGELFIPSSIQSRSSLPNIRPRNSSLTRRKAICRSNSIVTASSGSTPCIRVRSARSIRKAATPNSIRWRRSGTTTACN